MWRDRFRNDSGSPFEPGNALKNKNFNEATFHILAIALVIVVLYSAIAILFIF
jgi:hypothetical protein